MNGKTKYDQIGKGYNRTRRADPFLLQQLQNLLAPHPEKQYLDIGCGSGNYTSALAKKGYQFVGIDPSQHMLDLAAQKSDLVQWKQGQAELISLADESMDGAIGSLTIHHWSDLNQGFKELFRVLKSNTQLVIFTALPSQMKVYWLNEYFPKMLEDSMRQMPDRVAVFNAINSAGFNKVEEVLYSIQPDLQDLFLYSGKHDPDLYFDPVVRAGISSFSALANEEEVGIGLQQLEVDIKSGAINEVIKRYENDTGDYLFLRCTKG